jgi:hypothetical protein
MRAVTPIKFLLKKLNNKMFRKKLFYFGPTYVGIYDNTAIEDLVLFKKMFLDFLETEKEKIIEEEEINTLLIEYLK